MTALRLLVTCVWLVCGFVAPANAARMIDDGPSCAHHMKMPMKAPAQSASMACCQVPSVIVPDLTVVPQISGAVFIRSVPAQAAPLPDMAPPYEPRPPKPEI